MKARLAVRKVRSLLLSAIVSCAILEFVPCAFAQMGPEQGAHEIELWTSGGHSVPGGTRNTGIWNAGLRYGWVLTAAHGPRFLHGEFEYAIDAVPLYLIFQPRNTAHGIGVNPLNLKWNFLGRAVGPVSPSELVELRSIIPYAELSGGLLFTDHRVPSFTSTVNFTPSAAFGIHILRPTRTWTVEARYLHISNAGLERFNPGLNTFEVRIGVGKFNK